MRFRILLATGSAALLVATAASGHEFWLQPSAFWVAPGGSVSVGLFVGHGADRARWRLRLARIVAFGTVGRGGAFLDQRSTLHEGPNAPDAQMSFPTPGLHVVSLQTNDAFSTLPGDRFEAYARDEGLTPVLEARRGAAALTPGRERYSRRAKALVQVGAVTKTDRAEATRPVGQSLEIVPEIDPYDPGSARTLPLRVINDGRPLAGALVRMTDLDADAAPFEQHLTDGAGRAVFTLPRKGRWQIGVIWSRPVENEADADFATTFSSLTFGFEAPVDP